MIKKLVLSIVSLIFLFLIWWYLLDDNRNFYKISNKEYSIPGLNTSFSSQGLCKVDNLVLISGYMSDKKPSRIYVLSDEVKYYELEYKNKKFNGHTGGIASDGNMVWIGSEGKIYYFKYEKLKSNKKTIELEGFIDTLNGADFLSIYDDNLYVGEFYLKDLYKTDKTHHIKGNNAIVFRFKIDRNKESGLDNIPNLALSIRSQIQGMIVTSDRIVLSKSYGLPKSHIYFYKNITKEFTNDTFKYKNEEIPLFILSDEDLIKDIKIPSMSEEIELIDNRVFINFENASKKYKLFTRERLKNIYSIPLY